MVREICAFPSEVDQHLVRLYESSDLEPQLRTAGIGVTWLGLRSSWGAYGWPVGVARLVREIRRFRPDVIHSSLFAANLVAQTAATLCRRPILSTFVLSGEETLLESYQPRADTRRARILRKVASFPAKNPRVHFRAITEDAAVTNARLLGVSRDRIAVIPRGVILPDLDGPLPTRAELGLPAEGPIILNVARLARQKGQVHLVRAFVSVLERVPEARLVIVGRPGDAAHDVEEEISSLGLGEAVTLVGYRSDVEPYLRHASVFAFPSLMEGLGTSVLEAMAAGLPVVAFDIPPVREVTGEGAVARLVPPGDETRLADEICSLLIHGDEDLGGRARRWVEQRYRLELVTSSLVELLSSTAGR
jgi:glycosyltransferase involved in cell wall biosynthesis